jgi:uncharacterized protein YdaU (DUF1376 family)
MSRKHVPYFRFYPSDFMTGVRGMTAQEVGVYTMLLCLIYEANGPVENNPLRLATYCGMRLAAFDRTCEKLIALGKIVEANGHLSNARAEAEISKRADDLEIASTAGKASWQKRQEKQGTQEASVKPPLNHTDTDTEKKERDTIVSQKKSVRGSRLGPDWTLPDDWRQWALDQGLAGSVIDREADRFRDYWIGKSGKDAAKADWQATWRNWVRKLVDSSPKPAAPGLSFTPTFWTGPPL